MDQFELTNDSSSRVLHIYCSSFRTNHHAAKCTPCLEPFTRHKKNLQTWQEKVPQYKKEGDKEWGATPVHPKQRKWAYNMYKHWAASQRWRNRAIVQQCSASRLCHYAYFGCLVGSSLAWQTSNRRASTTTRWTLCQIRWPLCQTKSVLCRRAPRKEVCDELREHTLWLLTTACWRDHRMQWSMKDKQCSALRRIHRILRQISTKPFHPPQSLATTQWKPRCGPFLFW